MGVGSITYASIYEFRRRKAGRPPRPKDNFWGFIVIASSFIVMGIWELLIKK